MHGTSNITHARSRLSSSWLDNSTTHQQSHLSPCVRSVGTRPHCMWYYASSNQSPLKPPTPHTGGCWVSPRRASWVLERSRLAVKKCEGDKPTTTTWEGGASSAPTHHLRHRHFSRSRHGKRVAALRGEKKRRRRRRGGRRSSVVVGRAAAAAAAAAAKGRDRGSSAITTTTTSVRNTAQDDALAGGNTRHHDGSNQWLRLGQPPAS